jgi:hypothetical protein
VVAGKKAKAHRLALFVGRREVAGYETHGRVYFAGGEGGREWRSFFAPGLGSDWEPLEYETLTFPRTSEPRGTTSIDR